MKSVNRAKGDKGEATRARILRAAAECIASLGVEKTSITRIASKAKVSRGLVAHYFPKKDRLFDEVVIWIAKEAGIALGEETDSTQIARINLEFLHENPVYAKCFMLMYYYASFVTRFKKLNATINQRAVDRLKLGFERRGLSATHAAKRAESFHRELVGALIKYHAVEHGRTLEQYSKEMLELLNRA